MCLTHAVSGQLYYIYIYINYTVLYILYRVYIRLQYIMQIRLFDIILAYFPLVLFYKGNSKWMSIC